MSKLYIAILVPIALGAIAVGAYGGPDPAGTAMANETANGKASMATALQAVAESHRIARAKCGHLVGVERGNCRTEARAEAKRALKVARATGVPS